MKKYFALESNFQNSTQFRYVCRKSGMSQGEVLQVVTTMLQMAIDAPTAGALVYQDDSPIPYDDIAAECDLGWDKMLTTLEAMEKVGMIIRDQDAYIIGNFARFFNEDGQEMK